MNTDKLVEDLLVEDEPGIDLVEELLQEVIGHEAREDVPSFGGELRVIIEGNRVKYGDPKGLTLSIGMASAGSVDYQHESRSSSNPEDVEDSREGQQKLSEWANSISKELSQLLNRTTVQYLAKRGFKSG